MSDTTQSLENNQEKNNLSPEEQERSADKKEQAKTEAVSKPIEQTAEADWKQAYLQIKADFENYKRRTQKQWDTHMLQYKKNLWCHLLDWIDDLHRVNEGWPKTEVPSFLSVKKGLDLVMKKLDRLLENQEIKEIPIKQGDSFNPEQQEALSTLPASPEHEGKVVQLVRKGYQLQGEVIRHAQVITGKRTAHTTISKEENRSV